MQLIIDAFSYLCNAFHVAKSFYGR